MTSPVAPKLTNRQDHPLLWPRAPLPLDGVTVERFVIQLATTASDSASLGAARHAWRTQRKRGADGRPFLRS